MTGPGLLARWLGPAARRVNRHETVVAAPAERTYSTALEATLREMPIGRLLYTLRGIPFRKDMTVAEFFGTPPFLVLEDDRPREIVFGIGRRAQGRRLAGPDEFRAPLENGGIRAVGNFRVEATSGGARLSTETWVETSGHRARLAFRVYWLFVGPFSGLIRRELLRTARRRAEAV